MHGGQVVLKSIKFRVLLLLHVKAFASSLFGDCGVPHGASYGTRTHACCGYVNAGCGIRVISNLPG